MQLKIYYLLQGITVNFFPSETIPNMYFGGNELKLIDTIIKTFSWAFAFFTIKMVLNYNAYKLEGIALEEKVRQEEINIISGRIDTVFMEKSIESIKDLVLLDVKQAREALTQLSDVLRYNLTQENHQFVTVQQELLIVKNYLNLIRWQYRNELIFNENIPSEFQKIKITPIKFLNIVKKIVDHNTIAVTMTISELGDNYRVTITILSKQREIEFEKDYLDTLFTDNEHLKLINNKEEFILEFKIYNKEKQD